jgi:competence protein ComEC
MAAIDVSVIETGPVSPVFLGIYYAVLAVAIWIYSNRGRLFKRPKTEQQPTESPVFHLPRTAKWMIAPLVAAAVLTVYTAVTMPDDRLHVSFLDVGEGDAILIQKGSRQVLVDGGPSPQAIGLELGKQMPYWDRTIDLLVLTHPHSDHMTGLVEVIQRYRVTGIMETNCDYESPLYREWHRIIDEKGIAVTTARAGLRIDMGDGIIIDVLNPDPKNNTVEMTDPDNNSIVLRLTTGDISFLLTGDIMRETERELVREGAGLESIVLKAAHHGSDTSTTAEFLAAVDPDAAVISCGKDNKHGHPSEEVLSRLEGGIGADNIYRTDEDGTVEFITDGERLWVETEK